MEISFSEPFKKTFSKKIKGTTSEDKFWRLVEIFSTDPYSKILRTHKLSGKLDGL